MSRLSFLRLYQLSLLLSAAPVFVFLLIACARAAPVLRNMALTVGNSNAEGSITSGGKPRVNVNVMCAHLLAEFKGEMR